MFGLEEQSSVCIRRERQDNEDNGIISTRHVTVAGMQTPNGQLAFSTVNNDLLSQISHLIAPPVIDKRSAARRTAEYKKPRTINCEYCNFCHDYGDLVCCDECPASFHLICHNPPLDEKDVPYGKWKCHRCSVLPSWFKDSNYASTSSNNNMISTESRAKKIVSEIKRNESVVNGFVRSRCREVQDKNPLITLSEAAAVMNSEEFELSGCLNPGRDLPGSLSLSSRNQAKKGKKLPHELDQDGLVSLPAKVCFICRKSCRIAPLIQCDYCPLLFHGDCLETPLLNVPKGERWMCPNHVEHALDEKVLKSTSISERLRLWEIHAWAPVDEHRIKLNFLKNASKSAPPYRIKRRHLPINRTVVPQSVKDYYAKSKLRSKTRNNMEQMIKPRSTSAASSILPSRDEQIQLQWLSAVLEMQSRNDVQPLDGRAVASVSTDTDDLPSMTACCSKTLPENSCDTIESSATVNASSVRDCSQNSLMNDKDSVNIDRLALAATDWKPRNGFHNAFLPVKKATGYNGLPSIPIDETAVAILIAKSGHCFPLKSSITIGIGATCDVNTTLVKFCSKISPLHAAIIYDKASKSFELLNYSSTGTEVDGVLYAVEPRPPRILATGPDSLVRSFIQTNCENELNVKRENCNVSNVTLLCTCECGADSVDDYRLCYEGSCLLKSGSIIRLGCLEFVFNVL